MSLFAAFFLFVLVWWVTLFAVLPLGVKGQHEDESVVEGSEPGAPVKADMKRKLLINTGVALVVWAGICLVIMSGLIDLRGGY